MIASSTPTPLRLTSLFSEDEVFVGREEMSEAQLIDALVKRIARTVELPDVDRVIRHIVARECCSFSHLASGCGLIHAMVEGIQDSHIALAVVPCGCDCCVEKGQTVQLRMFFLLLSPQDEPSAFLRTLSGVTRLSRQPGLCEQVCELGSAAEVYAYLRGFDVTLPAYVTAADIMRTEYVALSDRACLSEAIDSFCRLRANELPIIDGDGDLVGVASAEELIHLCLPDYITWMEDLTPIIDFQPFAEILSRERDMPVVEIMLIGDRYATVDEDTPAVAVAKVMMRREVRQVLVLRGKRLVGLISLQDFIHKVLRA